MLTGLLSWVEKRGFEARQDRCIRLAQKRVLYLRSWWNVQSAVCAPEELASRRQAVSAELDQIGAELQKVLAESAGGAARRGERDLLQRLLLLYAPRTAVAWVWHTLFYVLLGMTAFLLYVALTVTESNWEGFGCLATPLLAVAVIAHILARRADRLALVELTADMGSPAAGA